MSTKQTTTNPCRETFNRGYHDAVNARAPQDADFYYMLGHQEGWPKRLVPTYISTPRGPVIERCTLERAAYILASYTKSSNHRTPGGRR